MKVNFPTIAPSRIGYYSKSKMLVTAAEVVSWRGHSPITFKTSAAVTAILDFEKSHSKVEAFFKDEKALRARLRALLSTLRHTQAS